MVKRLIQLILIIALFLFVVAVFLPGLIIVAPDESIPLPQFIARNIVAAYARLIDFRFAEFSSRDMARTHLDNTRRLIMLLEKNNALGFDDEMKKDFCPGDYVCGLIAFEENNKKMLASISGSAPAKFDIFVFNYLRKTAQNID